MRIELSDFTFACTRDEYMNVMLNGVNLKIL